MDSVIPTLAFAGSFVASSLALVRYALRENHSITERFTGFLERSLARQESSNLAFRDALEKLAEAVQDNAALLHRILERVSQ